MTTDPSAKQSAIDAARLGSGALEKWRKEAFERWRRESRQGRIDQDSPRLDLSGADLAGVNLAQARLSGADLRGANLRGADLAGASLFETDLTGAILVEADLTEIRGNQAKFCGAHLRHAKLLGAQLPLADLPDADVESAKLDMADLSGADLRRANLAGASLTQTTFFETTLRGARFRRATFGQTILAGIDLSACVGLEDTFHLGPSIVSVDTIARSHGNIPKQFLRGAGVPEQLLDQLVVLARQSNYYKCFISYTRADDEFVSKLHQDLETAGINCWWWPEDAKWGNPLIQEIDQAIRRYDKVVVVLSHAALRAPGVLDEIERALDRESRDGINVLFPIRLDDAVFTWSNPRRSNLLRKTIGDFSRWREEESYRVALQRLIDYLRVDDATAKPAS